VSYNLLSALSKLCFPVTVVKMRLSPVYALLLYVTEEVGTAVRL